MTLPTQPCAYLGWVLGESPSRFVFDGDETVGTSTVRLPPSAQLRRTRVDHDGPVRSARRLADRDSSRNNACLPGPTARASPRHALRGSQFASRQTSATNCCRPRPTARPTSPRRVRPPSPRRVRPHRSPGPQGHQFRTGSVADDGQIRCSDPLTTGNPAAGGPRARTDWTTQLSEVVR